jgi:hypothetical protein
MLTTQEVFPLSVGLLISIALRDDHGFCCDFNASLKALGWPVEADGETLGRKQRKGIINAYMTYYRAKLGRFEEIPSNLADECTGKGFYSPSKEDWYRSIVLPETVEFAEGWCETYS